MKKTLSIVLAIIMTLTFVAAGMAYAGTTSDLENELDSVQSEKDDVSAQLADVKSQIDTLQPKVDSLNAEVAEANSKIAETENAIVQKEQEMQEREDGLNERLRVMYKNGSVGFLDVLLGSNSISEFVSNLEMIQKIYKNDMDVLETLKQEQQELQEIKDQLKEQKAELEVKKAELDEDMSELNSLKSQLEKEEDRLLEEAKALTEKIKNMTSSDSEYVGGGSWIWPAPASRYLTSEFGWRIHPVYNTWKYHSGIDIAAGNGTNVLAAANGTVILSQEYGGYGQCIMIDHGGGIVTLYGHMQNGSRRVSVGDTVTAGQVIGLVGSTGVSTGPHLHFEVRLNGELVDPMDYVG